MKEFKKRSTRTTKEQQKEIQQTDLSYNDSQHAKNKTNCPKLHDSQHAKNPARAYNI